jgi:hypothetical protein
MKFMEMLKSKNNAKTVNTSKEGTRKIEEAVQTNSVGQLIEKEKKPEEILRRAGFKIKLVNMTAFGTQIDFAKKYDETELKDVLKDFKIKIKDKSLFIVE